MFIEVAVFGHQQGFDQFIREAAAGQEQTLLTIRGLHHGDQFRIEAEKAEFAAVIHVFYFFQSAAAEGQTGIDLPFFTVRKIKRAAQHLNGITGHRKFTGTGDFGDFAVLHAFQQFNHLIQAVIHTRLKVNGASVNRGRQIPDFAVQAVTDFSGQINAVDPQQDSHHNAEFDQEPEPAPAPFRRLVFAPFFTHARSILFIVIIIIRLVITKFIIVFNIIVIILIPAATAV
ncbi:Uncharacterised protein [Morganella morganii]|nr:Uncharacterised protein [Morganella morganii]